jgi:hypothetical protein
MQGRSVSPKCLEYGALLEQMQDLSPRPSASLRDEKNGALDFLSRIRESLSVLGSVLAVIHPTLFVTGVEILGQLSDGIIPTSPTDVNILRKVLDLWATPFTALSIINNRQTDLHRDLASPLSCYDLLYTGGGYSNGRFEVPALGFRGRYDPGTMVALLASTFPHGVGRVEGSRVCLAHFFREDMLTRHPYYRTPKIPTLTSLMDLYCPPHTTHAVRPL